MNYGMQIRDGLNRKMMSQETLAQMLGVSQKTVSRYVRGSRVPIAKQQLINEILDIKVETAEPVLREYEVAVEEVLNGLSTSDKIRVLGNVLVDISNLV